MTAALNTTAPRCANSRGHDTEMEVSMPGQSPMQRRRMLRAPFDDRTAALTIDFGDTNAEVPAAANTSTTSAQKVIQTRAPKITEVGFRLGCKPGNAGKVYDPDPPTDEEVVRVMDTYDQRRLSGRRQRALIAVLRGAGLRIHEALLLVESDIDFDRGIVVVRRGKGGKRRRSGINRGALLEVANWIDDRAAAGFTLDQPLFCVTEGPTKGSPLYQAYVRASFRDHAAKAGVTRRFAPHQLRHALALEMARQGVPLPVISRQLGHSNVATTSTYLQGISDDEVFNTVAAMDWGTR